MNRIYMLTTLFSFLLFISCNSDDPTPTAPADEKGAVSYLALGDSYTIGESVAAEERFPVLLARELEEEGIPVAGPRLIATTGWTTSDLKNAIAGANLMDEEFDLVSLLIGVNNQYQGRSQEEYRQEFQELLLTAIDLAGGDKENVVVLSIPDYGYTPFGQPNQERISAEINQFNAINREISLALGVTYIDITPISRQGLNDPTLVASDGLHPSGHMYQQWVDLMLDEVKAMVQTP